MKFICLKYLDKNTGDGRDVLNQSYAFDQSLRESGHFFACGSVQTAGRAIGLCSRNGQLVVEEDNTLTLGGLMLLEARDLNHAIVLISEHPGMRLGWFVIHPAEEGSLQ